MKGISYKKDCPILMEDGELPQKNSRKRSSCSVKTINLLKIIIHLELVFALGFLCLFLFFEIPTNQSSYTDNVKEQVEGIDSKIPETMQKTEENNQSQLVDDLIKLVKGLDTSDPKNVEDNVNIHQDIEIPQKGFIEFLQMITKTPVLRKTRYSLEDDVPVRPNFFPLPMQGRAFPSFNQIPNDEMYHGMNKAGRLNSAFSKSIFLTPYRPNFKPEESAAIFDEGYRLFVNNLGKQQSFEEATSKPVFIGSPVEADPFIGAREREILLREFTPKDVPASDSSVEQTDSDPDADWMKFLANTGGKKSSVESEEEAASNPDFEKVPSFLKPSAKVDPTISEHLNAVPIPDRDFQKTEDVLTTELNYLAKQSVDDADLSSNANYGGFKLDEEKPNREEMIRELDFLRTLKFDNDPISEEYWDPNTSEFSSKDEDLSAFTRDLNSILIDSDATNVNTAESELPRQYRFAW